MSNRKFVDHGARIHGVSTKLLATDSIRLVFEFFFSPFISVFEFFVYIMNSIQIISRITAYFAGQLRCLYPIKTYTHFFESFVYITIQIIYKIYGLILDIYCQLYCDVFLVGLKSVKIDVYANPICEFLKKNIAFYYK